MKNRNIIHHNQLHSLMCKNLYLTVFFYVTQHFNDAVCAMTAMSKIKYLALLAGWNNKNNKKFETKIKAQTKHNDLMDILWSQVVDSR